MDTKSINFLRGLTKHTEARVKQFSSRRIAATLVSLALLLGLAYTTRAVISGDKLSQSLGNASVLDQLKHLVGADDKKMAGEENGRINVLLLGIGGEGHEGGELTDTMMVASIDPAAKRLGLLSIPRDLVVPIPEVGWQKINAAHAYGKLRNPESLGGGATLARKTVEDITGLEVHYYVKIDFAGFTKVVDAVGGIRINVRESFTDYQYPDSAYGYEPVHFEAGWQTFDGATALKYVRSRHGTAGEGSDFARARRQQEVLRALQGRLLALSTILNPGKLVTLADIVGENLETDLELWEALRLYELSKTIDTAHLNQVVLSTEGAGLLAAETGEDGSYLLRPRLGSGNFSELQLVAQHLLDDDPYQTLAAAGGEKPIRIAVLNGTAEPGLAAQTAELLSQLRYQVTLVGNAARRDYERTVIYNVSQSDQNETISALREQFNANIAPSLPGYIQAPDADVLIIVGKDRRVS
ncbi:MAG: LCP family protein [Parcubacteria group bacterium]|nr:LCP family protein [Parcubacteria group bacterium]